MNKLRRLKRAFAAAFSGLRHVLVKEPSFQVMVLVALIVTGAMFYFPTSMEKKALLLVAIFAVLGLELINSVVERILNIVQPEYDERVKEAKDLMAAVVLVASIGAAIVGIVIFWPYLFP